MSGRLRGGRGQAAQWSSVPFVPFDPTLLVVLVIFLALVATAISLTEGGVLPGRGARIRPHRDDFRQESAPVPPRKRAAVIINPVKFADHELVMSRLTGAAAALGWDEPWFRLTTPEDPGTGQARAATAEGVDVVCSLGGDGTIRAVAAGLAGTQTPLGLLPAGTGNLLARNLNLPIDDLEQALTVACTGRNKPVDVGWVTLDPEAERADTDPVALGQEDRHIFLVMAGLGFDAQIMSETTEAAKAKLGWTAYVATGLKNLRGPRLRAHLSVDGEQPQTHTTRTVLIGNCGKLTGGINLMPDALVDDGHLDCVLLSPKGLPGWVDISAQVLSGRGRGLRSPRLIRRTGERFEVSVDHPEAIELDGDVIGTATRIVATIEPRSLIVRVPAVTDPSPPTPAGS